MISSHHTYPGIHSTGHTAVHSMVSLHIQARIHTDTRVVYYDMFSSHHIRVRIVRLAHHTHKHTHRIVDICHTFYDTHMISPHLRTASHTHIHIHIHTHIYTYIHTYTSVHTVYIIFIYIYIYIYIYLCTAYT